MPTRCHGAKGCMQKDDGLRSSKLEPCVVHKWLALFLVKDKQAPPPGRDGTWQAPVTLGLTLSHASRSIQSCATAHAGRMVHGKLLSHGIDPKPCIWQCTNQHSCMRVQDGAWQALGPVQRVLYQAAWLQGATALGGPREQAAGAAAEGGVRAGGPAELAPELPSESASLKCWCSSRGRRPHRSGGAAAGAASALGHLLSRRHNFSAARRKAQGRLLSWVRLLLSCCATAGLLADT
eukprot:803044-Pelagomonas_calceolata.AAC.11